MAVLAALTWQPISLANAAPFLLLGPIVVTAQYCIVRGYALASLAVVGPVDYFWLVFAALIGLIGFGEVPTIGVIVGSVVIAGGGVVLAFADHILMADGCSAKTAKASGCGIVPHAVDPASLRRVARSLPRPRPDDPGG